MQQVETAIDKQATQESENSLTPEIAHTRLEELIKEPLEYLTDDDAVETIAELSELLLTTRKSDQQFVEDHFPSFLAILNRIPSTAFIQNAPALPQLLALTYLTKSDYFINDRKTDDQMCALVARSLSQSPLALAYDDQYPRIVTNVFDQMCIEIANVSTESYQTLLAQLLFYRYGFDRLKDSAALDNLAEAHRLIRLWKDNSGRRESIRLSHDPSLYYEESNKRHPTMEEQFAREVAWSRINLALLEGFHQTNELQIVHSVYRNNGIANFARYGEDIIEEQYNIFQEPHEKGSIYIFRLMTLDDYNGAFSEYYPVNVYDKFRKKHKIKEIIIEASTVGECVLRMIRTRKTLDPPHYIVESSHGSADAMLKGNIPRGKNQLHALASSYINIPMLTLDGFEILKEEFIAPYTQLVADACSVDDRTGRKYPTLGQVIVNETGVPLSTNTEAGWADQRVYINNKGQAKLTVSKRQSGPRAVRTILPFEDS
jgi:hypothetical protein